MSKIDIGELTLNQIKEIAAITGNHAQETEAYNNGMIGKYVIVRCRDAGVHAGTLLSHHNRECVLTNSRRLYYWKAANNSATLSGVSQEGIESGCKIMQPIPLIHLTETCEIIECTDKSRLSIVNHEVYKS